MPVYQFAHSGVPLSHAERDRLARGITEIHHSETNAPEPFVRVVFEPMPFGTVYTAGEISPSVLLNCGIRTGRSDATRRRILQRCYDLASEVTQLPPDQILVAVTEGQSSWIMEAGLFLPEANDEADPAWIKQLQQAYRGRYDKWGNGEQPSFAEPRADRPANCVTSPTRWFTRSSVRPAVAPVTIVPQVTEHDPVEALGRPEVIMAIMPGGGGTQRPPQLIGSHRALKHILEGAGMSPAEALACGAVDELVPRSELLEHALGRAVHLGARDKPAVAAAKRAVYVGGSMALEDGLALERTEFLQVLATPRAQELMLAPQAAPPLTTSCRSTDLTSTRPRLRPAACRPPPTNSYSESETDHDDIQTIANPRSRARTGGPGGGQRSWPTTTQRCPAVRTRVSRTE